MPQDYGALNALRRDRFPFTLTVCLVKGSPAWSPQPGCGGSEFAVSTNSRQAIEMRHQARAANVNITTLAALAQLLHERTSTQMHLPPEVRRTPQLPRLR